MIVWALFLSQPFSSKRYAQRRSAQLAVRVSLHTQFIHTKRYSIYLLGHREKLRRSDFEWARYCQHWCDDNQEEARKSNSTSWAEAIDSSWWDRSQYFWRYCKDMWLLKWFPVRRTDTDASKRLLKLKHMIGILLPFWDLLWDSLRLL